MPAEDCPKAHVITRYRDANSNLRTQLELIIAKAGLKPWPKLFQNLCVTRATELAAEYPSHVAAEWLGHSTMVAQKHYWRVTDADFAKATAVPEEPVHNAVQSASVSGGSDLSLCTVSAAECDIPGEFAGNQYTPQESNL